MKQVITIKIAIQYCIAALLFCVPFNNYATIDYVWGSTTASGFSTGVGSNFYVELEFNGTGNACGQVRPTNPTGRFEIRVLLRKNLDDPTTVNTDPGYTTTDRKANQWLDASFMPQTTSSAVTSAAQAAMVGIAMPEVACNSGINSRVGYTFMGMPEGRYSFEFLLIDHVDGTVYTSWTYDHFNPAGSDWTLVPGTGGGADADGVIDNSPDELLHYVTVTNDQDIFRSMLITELNGGIAYSDMEVFQSGNVPFPNALHYFNPGDFSQTQVVPVIAGTGEDGAICSDDLVSVIGFEVNTYKNITTGAVIADDQTGLEWQIDDLGDNFGSLVNNGTYNVWNQNTPNVGGCMTVGPFKGRLDCPAGLYGPFRGCSGSCQNNQPSGDDLIIDQLWEHVPSVASEYVIQDLRAAVSNIAGDYEIRFRTYINTTGGDVTAWYTIPFTILPVDANLCGTEILPVEILEFSAKKNGRDVELSWKTATEINSDYFQVERSLDGKRFEAIAKVGAVGHSSSEVSYEYIDNDVDLNVFRYYYRLKQFDLDGSYEYSDVKTILINNKKSFVLLSPNPTNGSILLESVNFGKDLKVTILNSIGALVHNDRLDETVTHEIDLSHLPKGLYFVNVSDGINQVTKKLIKN